MNAHLIQQLRQGFVHAPVQRAWLFGSFARNEEMSDSDVDVMVRFDKGARISLLDYAGIMLDLEKIVRKKVDLVTEGGIKKFAEQSIEDDKILVYERAD